MNDHAIDLHGQGMDRGRIGYLIEAAVAEAGRRGAGLRIIHGRGGHMLAELAQSILEERGIAYAEGWRNPGETRVEAKEAARAARIIRR